MDSFHLLPVGSIYSREEHASLGYLDIIQNIPLPIKDMISSTETASYVRGLGRTYGIPEESQASISFAILEIAIGKKPFAQLSKTLSSELQLPNNEAQNMASEIERDIFGPIKRELSEFLRESRQSTGTNSIRLTPLTPSKPQNVLDLKELALPKRQPQLPIKQPQRSLPSRTNGAIPVPNKLPAAPSVTPKPSLPPRPATPPKRPSSPIKPISFI